MLSRLTQQLDLTPLVIVLPFMSYPFFSCLFISFRMTSKIAIFVGLSSLLSVLPILFPNPNPMKGGFDFLCPRHAQSCSAYLHLSRYVRWVKISHLARKYNNLFPMNEIHWNFRSAGLATIAKYLVWWRRRGRNYCTAVHVRCRFRQLWSSADSCWWGRSTDRPADPSEPVGQSLSCPWWKIPEIKGRVCRRPLQNAITNIFYCISDAISVFIIL